MKKELDEKLCKDFPLLYRDQHGDSRKTAMCFGFQVDDGWYDLIYKLSGSLENIITGMKVDNDSSLPRATTVKEKFGGLRFYVSPTTDQIHAIISKAESESYKICERCGEPGTFRRFKWLVTLCDKHADEQANDKENPQ